MDLVVQRISKRQRVRVAQVTTDHVLDVSESTEGKYQISLSKWETGPDGNERLTTPICKWETASGESFSSYAALDSRKGLVFAALEDRRRYVTLQVDSITKPGVLDAGARKLKLKSQLFAFTALSGICPDHDGDLVVALSDIGELGIMSATGPLSQIEERSLDPLPVDKVLAVKRFAEHSLAIIGLQRSTIVVCPIHFKPSECLNGISVEKIGPLQLPDIQKSVSSLKESPEDSVVDFIFDKRYMTILYRDGVVQLLRPNVTAGSRPKADERFGEWGGSQHGKAGDDAAVVPTLDHAFQLSPGLTADTMVPDTTVSGGMTQLDENYFAVGYGQFVSIWDWAYHVGHGFARLDAGVNFVSPGRSFARILVGDESGLQEVSSTDLVNGKSFSLALAIARKGTCNLIATDLLRSSETGPMRSQPVTVTVTKIAAEAEGDIDRIFRQKLEPLDGEELKLVRQMLNRNITSSPESLSRLTKRYTTRGRKVRRGNRGSYTELGLSELPSERLAAVSVARCLFEIQGGNFKFVVPLIDMIGTGVVSNEAVLAVLGTSETWSNGKDTDPLSLLSIVDPLLTSGMFMNALEAIVTRVADLPEPDIVRVVQFVIRLTHQEFSEFTMIKDGSESTAESGKFELLTHGTHLLLKCVTCAADEARVVESLRQIPVADVTAILSRFDHILKAGTAPADVKKRARAPYASRTMREGFFVKDSSFFKEEDVAKYRGVGDWIDDDEIRSKSEGRSAVAGCIEWSSHLIDAHLANLIMDKTGQGVAARLLETVRLRRGEFEVIKGLQGMTLHVMENKPIPSGDDPLYSNRYVDVPAYASLK